jgi:hypothetical protein
MEVYSISEELFFTVLRIETKVQQEKQKVATGFILSYEVERKLYLFLVTCKHLIEGAKEGIITFIKSDGQKPLLGNAYQLRIENFEDLWFKHQSETVDIAILPLVPILNHISNQGVQVFFKSIPTNLIPSNENLKELDAIEEVLFIGYPAGLWDPKNFTPVIRKGITTTPVFLDFKGEKQFLIDASVFPGSSGSPVFIYDKGIYWDKKSKSTIVGQRILFLGMLSAVFTIPDTGEIIYPLQRVPNIRVNQLVDLGVVFKAEIILDTIKEFLSRKLLVDEENKE